MQLKSETADETLRAFNERWPIQKVKELELEEYVGTNDKDTFCYWVEMRTITLGSIRGYPSNKFGIFKRGDNAVLPISEDFVYDDEYTWRKKFSIESKYHAFENVLALVVKTIELATKKNFREIDSIKDLNNMFKWKIAFLYSEKSLIPIFSKLPLKWCARELQMHNFNNARTSDLHAFLMKNKPEKYDCFEFAKNLYASFEVWKTRDQLNDFEQGAIETFDSVLEGKAKLIYSTKYERSEKLRVQALIIHGTTCVACGFNFKKAYGAWGENYIQVHHLKPLSQNKGEMKVYPEKDMVVLCANCHAMVHRKKDKALTVDELKKILKQIS